MHKACHSGSRCFTLPTLHTIFHWFLSSKCCSPSTNLRCCKQQSTSSRANMSTGHPVLIPGWEGGWTRLWPLCPVADILECVHCYCTWGGGEPARRTAHAWAGHSLTWFNWWVKLDDIWSYIISYVYTLQPCRAMQSPWMHATIHHFL